MAKFKVGDRVQLVRMLPFNKAGRMMTPMEKGVVIAVTDDTYTVEFDDSMTPVSGVTESEIKPE